MHDLPDLAAHRLDLKPPCGRCGQPFLQGSETECFRCLRQSDDPEEPRRRYRLKCDCGGIAVAVVFVSMRIGGVPSREPLPMCRDCLEIEIDTVVNYLTPSA